MGTIFVPIHMSPACFDRETDVLEADADFSRLPGLAGATEQNPDTPYLSGEVLRTDFEPLNLRLGAGIHLHWTLPAVYRRGFQDRGGAGALWHAPAPNRWLISRLADSSPLQQWVVESDYLSHPDAPHYHDGVTVPLDPSDGQRSFARLGRCVSLAEWLADTATHDRLTGLTVLGYGNPAFAAFYPNCRTVFGFHDPEPRGRRVTYELLGWQGAAADELLARFVRETKIGAEGSPDKLVTETFGWKVDHPEGIGPDDRIICFARATVDISVAPRTRARGHDLAIGNTGTEALSALLATKATSSTLTSAEIEDQLEAVRLASGLDHRQTDRIFKLAEARHENTFVATPGGTRWAVQAQRPGAPDDGRRHDTQTPLLLSRRVTAEMAEVNRLQRKYDKLTERIEGLRARIFQDWHRYMAAMYQGTEEADRLPDVDRIRAYMEDGDLTALDEAERSRGVLETQYAKDGRLVRLLSKATDPKTVSSRLAASMARLQVSVDMINSIGVSGALQGHARFEMPATGRARIELPDSESGVDLDHVDGLPLASLAAGTRMEGLTITLSFATARGSEGVILSYGAKDYFEVAVRQAGGAGVLVFSTSGIDRVADELISAAPVDDGNWHDVVLTYAAGEGRKTIILDGKEAASRLAHGGAALGSSEPRAGILGALGPGSTGRLSGSIGHVCVRPIAPSEEALKSPGLHSPILDLAVRPGAGARYWRPREPVILVSGPIARQDTRHDRDAGRLCRWVRDAGFGDLSDAAPRETIARALARMRDYVGAAFKPAKSAKPQDGRHWYPFALEWEVAFRPYVSAVEGSVVSRFDPDAMLRTFHLPPDEVDLSLTAGASTPSGHTSVFTGRSLLTKHSGRALLKAFETAGTTSPELVAVRSVVESDDFHVLSQALSGFNDAMLQTCQAFQLPVADPLAFDDYREFTEERVRNAVARTGVAQPRPMLGFHPLRGGSVEILRLRLIDTFGQVEELEVDRIIRSTALKDPAHDGAIVLAPRITQPARLNFRWLSRGSDQEEASGAARDNPICGWITPDYLDYTLLMHDADGRAVGRMTPDSTTPWREAIGTARTGSVESIANPHLRRVVRWLAARSADYRSAFVDVLHQSLANIHPDTFADHGALAFLMGRPLAVVRARLSLSLKGLPAIHQGWVVFRQDMHGDDRDSWGFESVRFPVRLGEHRQVNDGLLGYWLEEGQHALGADFFAPNSDAVSKARIAGLVHPGERDFNIPLSLTSEPVTVTMLIDPRGRVHATSGVLPVKGISVPPIHFTAALRVMEFSFPIAPVLTPRSALTVPLPKVPGFDVSWMARQGDGWRTTSADEIEPHEPHRTDTGKQELVEGWMKLAPRRDVTLPD